jgi:hypothetical protein
MLKLGVDAWNEWRLQIEPDLFHVWFPKFTPDIAGADLQGASLSGVNPDLLTYPS